MTTTSDYRRVGRKPCCFRAGMNAILLDQWQLCKGVSGPLLKAKSLRFLGETHTLGLEWCRSHTCGDRTSTPLLAGQLLSWKQEASKLWHEVVHLYQDREESFEEARLIFDA